VKTVFSIALGVIAAIGGFVDIGDLVFNAQAGASVGTPALWATPVGVVGIMVFAEMSGRIVAVSKKPNFVLARSAMDARSPPSRSPPSWAGSASSSTTSST